MPPLCCHHDTRNGKNGFPLSLYNLNTFCPFLDWTSKIYRSPQSFVCIAPKVRGVTSLTCLLHQIKVCAFLLFKEKRFELASCPDKISILQSWGFARLTTYFDKWDISPNNVTGSILMMMMIKERNPQGFHSVLISALTQAEFWFWLQIYFQRNRNQICSWFEMRGPTGHEILKSSWGTNSQTNIWCSPCKMQGW